MKSIQLPYLLAYDALPRRPLAPEDPSARPTAHCMDPCCRSDEDMTTLDMTKNIAYMHICQVISSANYSIIYLCYPEQKYFTHFCFLSNCRCMGHLYNPHMKIREKGKFRLCSKSPSHVTFGPREDRVQVSHVLDSDSDCTDIPDSKRT